MCRQKVIAWAALLVFWASGLLIASHLGHSHDTPVYSGDCAVCSLVHSPALASGQTTEVAALAVAERFTTPISIDPVIAALRLPSSPRSPPASDHC